VKGIIVGNTRQLFFQEALPMADRIAELAAKALPCDCECHRSTQVNKLHRNHCTATLRPAVEDAMRELAAEVVEEMVSALGPYQRPVERVRARAKERGWL
jgi:hypothetical protein